MTCFHSNYVGYEVIGEAYVGPADCDTGEQKMCDRVVEWIV